MAPNEYTDFLAQALTYHQEAEALHSDYRNKCTAYYRVLFQQQDVLLMSRISRIPDDWNRSAQESPAEDERRRRLADIKRYKSWELRLEIFYMYYLVDIETMLLRSLAYRNIPSGEIAEAIDSANSVLCEVESQLIDFRYLLLSVAKRSVCDLYYLMASYIRFFNSRQSDFVKDFIPFVEESANVFERMRKLPELIRLVADAGNKIEKYFVRSSNYTGWRLDEIAMKQVERTFEENTGIIADLVRILPAAYALKNRIRRDRDFLAFYYNRENGRQYRYNVVRESMLKKVHDKQTTQEIFDAFDASRQAFSVMKQQFDMCPLELFGPSAMPYGNLVDFIYKGCKVLEYFYLRKSQYEKLQNLRNDMLTYIENEYHKLNNIKAR
jgi:hypothetical protein